MEVRKIIRDFLRSKIFYYKILDFRALCVHEPMIFQISFFLNLKTKYYEQTNT